MRLGERQIAEESAPPQLLADETARRMSAWRLKALEVAQAKAAAVRRASTMHKPDLSQLMLKLTDDEVVAISRRMNARMAAPADATARQADGRRLQAEEEEEKAARTWIRMFRHVDDNGSGSVCFKELRRLVRDRVHGLGMDDDELPEQELKALWAELDENASGLISVGEWGRFMRRGMDRDAVERARRKRLEAAAAVRRAIAAEAEEHAAHRIAEMREEARGYDEEMLRLRAELESLQSEKELSTDARAELFASGSRTALSKCGSTAALSSTASVRAYGVPSGTPAAAVRARYAPGPLASAFGKVGRAAAAPQPPTAPRRQSVKAGSPRATALNRRSVTAHHIGDPSAVAALRR